MSLNVEVGLLSGKTATLNAGLDETVAPLKRRAETALGIGRGRLLDSSGSLLDLQAPIKKARVQDGDRIPLHRSPVQVQASGSSFAAILGDGSVAIWGTDDHSNSVQDQLKKNVQQIQACKSAFAAILGDGTAVALSGGGKVAMQDGLKNVQHIQATDFAFAARLGDGRW